MILVKTLTVIPLATTTSPGIVQIGQGINVDSAGNISVEFDDVDTNPGGGDNSYSFSFQPSAAIFNNNYVNKFSNNLDFYSQLHRT